VTGGAGYIGSHMVKLLLQSGAELSVLDDLSTGHPDAVRGGHFVRGDISDVAATASSLPTEKSKRSCTSPRAIFATLFAKSREPDVDFGSNVAGIVLGGLSEQLPL
jgi:UDP-glucose 4-epimerase